MQTVVDAATVARNAGLDLRRNGSRLWTCCPIHGEKTASMCFFPDGRFHCFGCGADGDAADLYAALHGVPLAEALRICKGESYTAKPVSAADNTRKKVERWYSAEWAAACREKHEALAYMASAERFGRDGFWLGVRQLARAEDRLNHLDSVKDDPVGKTMLYMEVSCERTRTA